MAPQKYKLTYVNVRGRAESIRLLFAAAGVEFEDERVEFKDWPQKKPTTQLEADGKLQSNQSMTISRHLAREFRLYGKNKDEQLVIDEVVDTSVDLLTKEIPAFQEQNPEKHVCIDLKLQSSFSKSIRCIVLH